MLLYAVRCARSLPIGDARMRGRFLFLSIPVYHSAKSEAAS